MRRTVTLKYFKDENGTRGLRVAHYKPFKGLMACDHGNDIAHDLLEHTEAIGPIEDEIQAVGAYWYIRGSSDSYDRIGYDVSEFEIADNLKEVIAYIVIRNRFKCKRCDRGVLRTPLDKQFRLTFKCARKETKKRIRKGEFANSWSAFTSNALDW